MSSKKKEWKTLEIKKRRNESQWDCAALSFEEVSFARQWVIEVSRGAFDVKCDRSVSCCYMEW